jgi:hypothetical protein
MKYVLVAMCGSVVLFMGGCSLLASSAGPIALLPVAITILNRAIIGALFGWKLQWKPAFYVLGIVDLIIAAIVLWMTFYYTNGSATDPTQTMLGGGIAAVIALKGVLSFFYAGRSA